jgi:hypothetical protein
MAPSFRQSQTPAHVTFDETMAGAWVMGRSSRFQNNKFLIFCKRMRTLYGRTFNRLIHSIKQIMQNQSWMNLDKL